MPGFSTSECRDAYDLATTRTGLSTNSYLIGRLFGLKIVRDGRLGLLCPWVLELYLGTIVTFIVAHSLDKICATGLPME